MIATRESTKEAGKGRIGEYSRPETRKPSPDSRWNRTPDSENVYIDHILSLKSYHWNKRFVSHSQPPTMTKKTDGDPLKAVSSHDPATEKIEDLADNDLTTIPSNVEGHVSYGKSGIAGLIESPYVLGAAFLASMGGFSFGYDQGVISIVNVMEQFHATFPRAETAFGKGFMTGMLEFGAFIGCFFMPTLADMISRKRALTVVVVIMQTAAQSYGVLVAGRTIGGIGVGTLAMVSRLRRPSYPLPPLTPAHPALPSAD